MTDDHSFEESDTNHDSEHASDKSDRKDSKDKKGRPNFKRVMQIIKILIKRNFWTFNAQFYVILAFLIYYFTAQNKMIPRLLMYLYRQLIKFESS